MTALCDCCDLPIETCGKAAEARMADEIRAERERALAEPGVVGAKFPGRCATCSTGYGRGEPIRHTDDGWAGAICCPAEG